MIQKLERLITFEIAVGTVPATSFSNDEITARIWERGMWVAIGMGLVVNGGS